MVVIKKPSKDIRFSLDKSQSHKQKNDHRCANCWESLACGRSKQFHPYRMCESTAAVQCIQSNAFKKANAKMPDVDELEEVNALEKQMDEARLTMIEENCVKDEENHWFYNSSHPVSIGVSLCTNKKQDSPKPNGTQPDAIAESESRAASQQNQGSSELTRSQHEAGQGVTGTNTLLLKQIADNGTKMVKLLEQIVDNGTETKRLLMQILESNKSSSEAES
ncbi:hypothetical protein PG987_004953 [Apiospora arundinis]